MSENEPKVVEKEKTVNYAEKELELFKEHSFNETQIKIYGVLKEKRNLSPERACWIVNSKRTEKVCLIVSEKYEATVKELELDKDADFQKLYDTHKFFKKLVDSRTFYFTRNRVNNIGCVYFNTGNHVIPGKEADRKLWMFYMCRMLEVFLKISPYNTKEGLYFITDFKKFGYSQFDTKMISAVCKLMLNLPMRMRAAICFDHPWWFSTVLALIRPFFAKAVMARFSLIERKDLMKHIPKASLIKEKGGDVEFDYDVWIGETFGIKRKK